MAESKTHTFTYSHKDRYDREVLEVRMGTNEVGLSELIEQFERYLKAAGFCFEDRRLELVYIETEEEE